MGRSLPSGVVTFLAACGIGADDLAAIAAEHGGALLRVQPHKDVLTCAFERPSGAARAAAAAHHAHGDAALALATGEAVPDDDGGYRAPAAAEAVRLCRSAAAGAVTLSAATAELLPDSVRALIAQPRPSLRELGVTRRESEVLEALREHLTNAEIAARLYVSERTIESHVSTLLRRLGVANRRELVAAVAELHDAEEPARPLLPAPFELLADRASHVGRDAELDRLRAAWSDASTGAVRVVVVTGEAGIGKSRLVAELAAEVHGEGGRVLLGACFEEAEEPYQPFAQLVADDAGAVAAHPALARLVPGNASAGAVDPLGEQLDVVTAIQRHLTANAATPTLVVIEDLHWATTATRETLRHVARASSRVPLLLVVTARDTAPDLDAELESFLGELARLPVVELVRLRGLDHDAVANLLGRLGYDRDPAAARDDTGGNPLLLRELASVGASTGTLSALLAHRYRRLADADLDVLDTAAVIGVEVDADLLAAATGHDLLGVLDVLERAEAAGLMTPRPGRPGRFGFVHALFRAARVDGLAPARRLELHQRVAAALAHRADEGTIAELARHACAAAPLGGAREAVAYAVRAGERAAAAGDHDDAAKHYARALDVVGLLTPPDESTRLAVMVKLGESLVLGGDPDGRDLLREAIAQARRAGDAAAMAAAVCGMVPIPGGSTSPGRPDPEFTALASETLALIGDDLTPTGIRLLSLLAGHLRVGSDAEQGFAMAADALDRARRLGDDVTLAHALMAAAWARLAPDNTEERLSIAEELVALGRRTGHSAFVAVGIEHRAACHRELGNIAEMRRQLEALARQRTADSIVSLALKANDALLAGDLAGAEERAESIRALASSLYSHPSTWFGPLMLGIRGLQDRLEEFVPSLERASTRPGFGASSAAALAVAHGRAGRLDAAAAAFEPHASSGFATVPDNLGWSVTMAYFSEAAALLGAVEPARVLSKWLHPLAGKLADAQAVVLTSIDHVRALLALTAGEPAEAAQIAEAAVARSRSRQTVIILGRELVVLAAARRALGAPVDHLVAEALDIADATGARLVRSEAARLGLLP